MIKIGRHEIGKAVITEMELAGQKFEIELLPCEAQEFIDVIAPCRRQKSVLNPLLKKMEMISYLDDNDEKYRAITDDLLDKLVVNFHGIGDKDGIPLDGTARANKILLGSVKVEDFEEIPIEDKETKEKAVLKQRRVRLFRALIFDRAVELAQTIAEAESKNSVSSPSSIAAAGR